MSTATLRQFQVFLEAARDQNFRRTADRLEISQPSLSKHINKLEAALGYAVFDRARGSSARLTSRGHALVPKARAYLAEARSIAENADLRRLRVAAAHYLLDRFIRPALALLPADHPALAIEFIDARAGDEVVGKVRADRADIGVYAGHRRPIPQGAQEVLATRSSGLFAAPGLMDRFERQGRSWREIPLIAPEEGTAAEEWVLANLHASGFEPAAIVARSAFPEVITHLAIDGVGSAVLTPDDYEGPVAQRALQWLPLKLRPSECIMVDCGAVDHVAYDAEISFLKQCLSSSWRG